MWYQGMLVQQRRACSPNLFFLRTDALLLWTPVLPVLQFVAEKTEYALSKGLKVILCVGETLEQRESNDTFNVISKQVGTHALTCMRCTHDSL